MYEMEDQKNVLLISDDEFISDEILLFLERKGFNTSFATSINNALIIIKNSSIDLIILDRNIIHQSSINVVKDIKSGSPNSKVMVISEINNNTKIIKDVFKTGVIDFLRKPIRFIDLELAIQRYENYSYFQSEKIAK